MTEETQKLASEHKPNLFSLGKLFATPGALREIDRSEMAKALARHHTGDWGDCDAEDWQANEEALQHDARLFSVYHSTAGVKFWIITEAGRVSTTVLLPDEY